MGTLEFLAEFKALHEKAKNGALTPPERKHYEQARTQFGRMVVIAQQLGHTGQTLRSNLRMAKVLKVELRFGEGEPIRASTLDLASGGFAILMGNTMKVGASAAFSLYLPPGAGSSGPIAGRVVVASARPHGALFRVSFRFETLHPTAQEQLEMALIDAVLERFSRY